MKYQMKTLMPRQIVGVYNNQNETCNRKKNTSTPTSSEEAGPARSQRQTGLRTKATPPTRLMALYTMLEDEPP